MASPISEFQSKLDAIRDRVAQMQSQVAQDATRNTAAISSRLQITMDTLFGLAVFVRGDYDGRPDDTTQKTELVHRLTDGCDTVWKLTSDFLTELGSLHAEAVELRATQVVPLSASIGKAVTDVQNSIDSYNQQIATVKQTAQQQQTTLETESESLMTLSSKLANAETLNSAVDIGVSIFVPIWGIINLIDHSKGPGSVGPLRDMVDSAQKAVDDARVAVNKTLDVLKELEDKCQALSALERAQSAIAAELPGQAALGDAAIQRIDTIEAGLIAAKGSSTEAVRRAAKLSNAALEAADLAISKKEFVEGILDVLEALVMDPDTASGAVRVIDELTKEYGAKGMPKELQDRCAALQTSVGKLLAVKVPS